MDIITNLFQKAGKAAGMKFMKTVSGLFLLAVIFYIIMLVSGRLPVYM